MKLMLERGFSNLSIEAVAAEAGVGKTTIYRRYPGKIELVLDAMSSFMRLGEVPDTGSLRGDLMALHAHKAHETSLRMLAGPASTLIGTVLAEKERHPELLDTFRKLVADRRREQFRTIVERAKRRGEIAANVNGDDIGPLIFGSLLARTVAGLEITDEVITRTVDYLLNGVLKR
jgi:AcrR family transcriptional regulator